MSEEKYLFIIDGNSLIYRAYYAIKGLSTKKGFPTNAIYGFYVMLKKLISEKKPHYIVLAFDVSRKSFRTDIYEKYKAQRPPMPDSLSIQLPYIKRLIKALRIPVLELENYEADDIIATIASKAKENGIKVVIVSGDKDLYQLVDDMIVIYNPSKEEFFDREKTKEYLGVYPENIPDFLALQGDSIDNIPGIKGVGKKTAVSLIEKYGNIDNLLNNIENVKPEKLKQKIKDGIDDLILSRKLTELKKDLPFEVELEKFLYKPPDTSELVKIFKELEFYSLLPEVDEKKSSKANYKEIKEKEELAFLLEGVKEKGLLCFDTETTSERAMEAELVGISFSFEEGSAYYLHLYENRKKSEFLSILKNFLEDENILKIGHNLKYDILVLENEGIEVKGRIYDTMVMAYLLNPNRRHHKLDDISVEYLGYKPVSYKELVGTGKKEKKIYEVEREKLVFYACEDSDVALKLYPILRKKLEEEKLLSVYENIEEPLIRVLSWMEKNGVKVDVEFLKELSIELGNELKYLESEIHRVTGYRFNINSTKQLGEILFEKLKLPVIKKTKKSKSYSTSVEVLEALKGKHPVIELLLRYRKIAKIKSTYADSLVELINPKTGRIHTSYNQTVAATGRLSSSDPNLQNIPIKDELGKSIRRAFIAEKGNYLISADYSQIELRVLAHFSEDPVLIDAYNKGKDIHSYTAEKVFGNDSELSDEEKRRRAKIINFSIIYGKTAHGLSEELSISHSEAQEFIDSYFREFLKVKEFIDRTIESAKKVGYVKTLFGRKRDIPELRSSDRNIQKQGERIAVNTVIQGTAADIIKIAMKNLYERIKREKLSSKMLLQVHDELVFETDEKEVEYLKKIVKEEMENCVKLKVPLVVDISVGKSWEK